MGHHAESDEFVDFLYFGRFLSFSENSTNCTILTERCFRQYSLRHGFRSDTMWLAKNWDGLHPGVNRCSHAHPSHIRQWGGA
jgi:hypothetical protein